MFIYVCVCVYVCVYVCVCVCEGVCIVSAYPQKHHPSLFFAKPFISQKIVKAPSPSPSLLANLSLYILVFCKAL